MFSSVKSGTCAVLTAFKTQAQNPSRREVHKLKHPNTWRVGSLAGCWQTKCNCAPRCSFRPPTTLLSSAQDSLELATVLTMHNAFVTFTSQCKPKGGKPVFQNNYLLENVIIWCFSRGCYLCQHFPHPPSHLHPAPFLKRDTKKCADYFFALRQQAELANRDACRDDGSSTGTSGSNSF